MISGQMTSLSGHFGLLRSRHVISCNMTSTSCKLQPCRKSNAQNVTFRPSIATSRWLPVKWHHFWVFAGHLRSLDVISCHATASSYEVQPCRKSNAQYTRVFGLLQQLPGDFLSNDVTSGHFWSPNVTWQFPVTWLSPPASYSLVGTQMHRIREFLAFYSHF